MTTNPYALRKKPKPSLKKREADNDDESIDHAHSSHRTADVAGMTTPPANDTTTTDLPLSLHAPNNDDLYSESTDEDEIDNKTDTPEINSPPDPDVDITPKDDQPSKEPTTNTNPLSDREFMTQLFSNLNDKIDKMNNDMSKMNNKMDDNQESIEKRLTESQQSQETLKNDLKKEIQLSQQSLKNELKLEIKQSHSELLTNFNDQMTNLKEEVDGKIKNHQSVVQDQIDEAVNDFKSKTELNENKQNQLESDLNKKISKSHKELKEHMTTSLSNHKEEIDDKLNNFITVQKETIQTIECSLEEKTTSLNFVTKSELESKISQLNQLKEQTNKPESNMTNIHVTCTGNSPEITLQNLPKFNGRQSNPKVFLERLHAYYIRYANRRNIKIDSDIDLLSEILENCLENHSARWWQLVKNEVNTWKEFEDMFLSKYWSRDVQRGIRQRLEIEKYRNNGPLTHAEYFIDRVIILQSLNPAPTEDEIISILAEHYDDVIKNARRVQNIENIRDFEALLQREDMLEKNNSLRNPNESRQFNRPPQHQQDNQRRPSNFNNHYNRDGPRNGNHRPRSPPFNQNPHFYQRNGPPPPAYNRNQLPPNQHRQPQQPPHYQSRSSQPPSHPTRSASYPTPEQRELYHTMAIQHTPQTDSSHQKNTSPPPPPNNNPNCDPNNNNHNLN